MREAQENGQAIVQPSGNFMTKLLTFVHKWSIILSAILDAALFDVAFGRVIWNSLGKR